MQVETAEVEIKEGDAGDHGRNFGATRKPLGGAVPVDVAPFQADVHTVLHVCSWMRVRS